MASRSDDNESTTSQPSINKFMKSSSTSKYGPKDPRQKAVTDKLVRYIAGNLVPLSTVESDDFKQFVEALDPKYQLPSRKHISTKLLIEKSTAIQADVKLKLHAAQSVSLTIDMWSNRQMKGFLGITGHFILDWLMESVMIACKRFRGRHTAENILQEYEEAIAYYGIGDKICNIISDNASNMTKAFEFSLPGYVNECEKVAFVSDSEDEIDEDDKHADSEMEDTQTTFPEDFPKHGRCYAHTLQLVVKDGLKEISSHLRNVIEKAAKIVKHTRHSLHATDILEGEKRLQAANETRWNSQIVMIRSVLNVPEEKLNKLDTVHLTTYERKLLQELCSILKPFEDATVMIQTENNVSASLAIPVTLGLEHQLNEISTTYSNKMVSVLKSSLLKRMSDFKSEDSYVLAAMLDPRFKIRWSNDVTQKTELETKLTSYARKQEVTTERIDANSPPSKVLKDDLFSFMTPTKRDRNISGDPVKQEVCTYLSEACEQTDPLKYWKEHCDKYPTLAILAKKYLCIPATSAPVERLFSIAGKVFRPERCRLSDNTFEMLMMIKCNK